MQWNPYLSALAAAAYIWGLGFIFQFLESTRGDIPDTTFAPILMLSLLVFSVALMGFLFFYRPVVLLLENKRNEAASYFLKTLATFGALTALSAALLGVL
jgi:hypothetical protein